MIFQTLDDKTECVGIYTDGNLYFDSGSFPAELTATWKHAPYLKGLKLEYASLYLQGSSISEHVPEYLVEDWEEVSSRLRSFQRSLQLGHVNTDENCFFDLVPQRFLIDYCEIKNQITSHILKTVPRPRRYEFHRQLSMLLTQISHQPLEVDHKLLQSFAQVSKYRNQVNNISKSSAKVNYQQFGTKTGRLTTAQGSFPILTLPKDLRAAVKASHDYYLELDFNGAEVRTMLGLLEKDQPPEDIHDFHLNKLFNHVSTREDAKVLFFSWLYGSKKAAEHPDAHRLPEFYETASLLEKHWHDQTITTPFGKTIKGVTEHFALNYLVQSTAAELMLKQALKINYLLETQGSGSRISFLIHDAIVIDMKETDEWLIPHLHTLMSSTNFGNFMVNVKKGSTLGSLREEKYYG